MTVKATKKSFSEKTESPEKNPKEKQKKTRKILTTFFYPESDKNPDPNPNRLPKVNPADLYYALRHGETALWP
jgi:hypothetical protein